MADIQLTPEELLSQSTEMFNLQNEYQSLFQQVKNSLEGINSSWSPNLASNFSGKITSAQNSFSSIINMFGNGANAAKASALRFGTPSSWLNSFADGVNGIWEDIHNIADLSDDELTTIFAESENYEDGSTVGKGVESVSSGFDNIASGFAESIAESFDPDREMRLGIQDEADRYARHFVEAQNSDDYVGMAYNGFMMCGLQTNYNLFNAATNAVGDMMSVPVAVTDSVDIIGSYLGVPEDNIGRVGARFTSNILQIGSSALKNLM